jgi:protocatechuate 3,4-dioxygenase beta subunit
METPDRACWYTIVPMNRRPLLVSLVLALLILAGAGSWLLLRHGPASREGAPLVPELANAQAGADASALDAQSAPGALEGSQTRAHAVPVGVRLSGPGRLEGRVIERETGLGVPLARVDLLPVPPAAGEFMGRMLLLSAQTAHMAGRVKPVAVAQTDARGAFHFEGVRVGTWFLDARGPYHVPETTVRARVLASGAGGPLDVFVLGGGRVLGTVFAPEGTPAPRARIVLVPGPGNFLTTLQNGDHRLIEAEADEHGAFVFEGVPPGDGWELTATGPGFALSHATGLRIVAGKDTQADVHGRIGGKIAGRVLSAAGKDGAGKDEPTPLAEAHLGAIPRGLRDLRCAEEILTQTHCVSAADGSFLMEHVPPGEIDVVAIAWGHLPAIGARVLSVDAAQTSAGDIVLARGPVISGRVVDGEGQPLEGVRLSWNLVDWKNFQFDFSFAPMMAQAVKGIDLPATGPDGVFHAGPVAGDAPWKIDFQKLGLVDASLSFDPAKDGEPAASNVTVVMHRGGALEGIVMDELAAEPVTTFTISTSDRVDTEADAPGGRNPFSGGITFEDAGGHFRLDSLKPGKVQLTVSAPGYPETKVDDVEVSESAVKKGLIVRLRPGATIRGKVENQDGHPVAGAQVVVVPASGRLRAAPGVRDENRRMRRRAGGNRGGPFGGGMLGGADELPPGMLGFAANLGLLGDRSVVSRTDGSFEIAGAEAGSVRLQAFQRDYAWGGSETFELVEGKAREGVTVTMHAGGGLEGTVTDRHGRPLSQAIVAAFSPGAFAGSSANAGGLYEGETDQKGDYAIRHITPGSYFVVVTRGDAELNPLSFFGTLNFDLVSVPEDEVVRYDLVDSAAGGCRVHGRVSDEGQPVTRGMLAAMRFDGDSVLGLEMKASPLDSQGRYEFAGLAPGDYQLNLDGQGGQVRMSLEVPDAPELELDLELPHGGIEGTVLDDASSEPVPGAEVLLNSTEPAPQGGGGLLGGLIGRENRSQRRTSDERGRYRFERLRTAEYELVVRGPRDNERRGKYAPSAPRRIQADERRTERNVDLRLPAALSLKGLVKDAQGAPVKGASVVATPEGGAASLSERAQSGEDGSYELRGLAPGNYSISASAKEFADFEKKGVELKRLPGRDNELEIVLQKGVRVRVRIVDASGRPVAGAYAQLVPKGGRAAGGAGAQRILNSFFQGDGNSADDGLLELGRYTPGEYRLEVQRGFAKAAKDPVKIEAGREEQELQVELP